MQHDMNPAVRREQLNILAFNVIRWSCAGEVNGLDALAVVDAVRAIRDALPAEPAPVDTETSDAA